MTPEDNDEWLVLKRSEQVILPGAWQPVQGHIEAGETAYQCAARELREETGLRPKAFYQVSAINRFYLAQYDQVILSPVFLAVVASNAKVQLSDEHESYAWLTPDDAVKRMQWPGQRESLWTAREQFILDPAPRPESRIDHLLDGTS